MIHVTQFCKKVFGEPKPKVTFFLTAIFIINQGNWRISSNREDSNISLDSLSQSRIFVIGGPREKFTEHEINHLKKYLETGGSILVLLGTYGVKTVKIELTWTFLSEHHQSRHIMVLR